MGKGLTLDIAANTRDFQKGTKDVEGALDKVADSLDDVSRDGDKAADKLEKSFSDAQREITRNAKASTAETGRAFEVSAREQTHLRREAIKEIGNEAKQNAAETFSSFDGSAQSFVDGIQGTFGGLVSSLGPIGLALGAAGAAGIGLVNGLLAKGAEATDKFKERVGNLTQSLIDAGSRSKPPLDSMVSRLQELQGKGDDAGNTLQSLSQAAKDTGIPFDALAQAYAGNTEAIAKYLPQLREMAARQHSYGDETNFFAENIQDANDKQLNASQRILDIVDQQRSELTAAAADAKVWAESGIPELQAKAKVIDTVNTAYDDAAGAASDFVDDESGLFDVTKYITAMQAREQALRDYQQTLASSSLSDDAKAFLNDQGEEAAATFLAGYKAATPAQQAELNRIWSEAGKSNSGAYTEALKAGIPGTLPGPTITPHLDFTKADADLQSFLAKRRADIQVGIVYRNGKPVI